jgi:hypothetical protein
MSDWHLKLYPRLSQSSRSVAANVAVKGILWESALAERLSRNARAKAEQFDWSMILPQWAQILMSADRSGPSAGHSASPPDLIL